MSTERRNPRSVDIDLFPTERILRIINAEDATVAAAVAAAIPEIAKTVDLAVETIRREGRIFYVGAGSSGRIAMLDAAEYPPTFSLPAKSVQAIVSGAGGTRGAGGDEDDTEKGAASLRTRKVSSRDLVIGIAASGKTPYTLGALEYARSKEAKTVAVVAARESPMSRTADVLIYTAVGPEIITGSTRMKAGTAQKLVLNMISTATMVRIGMTYSNWMINVSMTNSKLHERGAQMVREILGVSLDEARKLAGASGGKLKLAIIMGSLDCDCKEAERRLAAANGNLRKVLGHLGGGRE